MPLLILMVIALSHVIYEDLLLATLRRALEYVVPGEGNAVVVELNAVAGRAGDCGIRKYRDCSRGEAACAGAHGSRLNQPRCGRQSSSSLNMLITRVRFESAA